MTHDEARSLLKVGPRATHDEIRRAYRTEAQKYHPDTHLDQPEHVVEIITARFRALTEARDLLLNQDPTAERDQSPLHDEIAAIRELLRQRRFSTALEQVARLIERHPNRDNFDLLVLRFQILSNADRDAEAVSVLHHMRALKPEVQDDLEYLEALIGHEIAAGQPLAALKTIDRCEQIAGNAVPIYIAARARALILAGRTSEADQVIDRLKAIDPTHPLVLERSSVARVGNTYVNKNDAAAGGCCLCMLLECIFDCL